MIAQVTRDRPATPLLPAPLDVAVAAAAEHGVEIKQRRLVEHPAPGFITPSPANSYGCVEWFCYDQFDPQTGRRIRVRED